MAEIKSVEDLRAAYPDFIGQVENDAKSSERAEGIKAERARIQGIEAIEAAIGDKEMVKNAKYGENPLTAEQLAFKAMTKQAAIGATVLNQMEKDAKDSGAAEVEVAPADNNEGDPKVEEDQVINMIAGFRPKNMKEGK